MNPLEETSHRPHPLPTGMWRMRQRWRDLLFAHWPVSPEIMAAHLPPGLEVDTFDGEAWLGVVPFWMDRVEVRAAGEQTVSFPTTRTFNELNLRTYVRSPRSGLRGVYFFSLDCDSPLAVVGARTLFHLPYFFAGMARSHAGETLGYASQRILAAQSPRFEAAYAPTADVDLSQPGSIGAFLTERYCLFTESRGRILRGDIHHVQWPLQPAEARIVRNDIPAAHGFTLPDVPPLLHYSRMIEVYIWGLVEDRAP